MSSSSKYKLTEYKREYMSKRNLKTISIMLPAEIEEQLHTIWTEEHKRERTRKSDFYLKIFSDFLDRKIEELMKI